MIKHIIQAAAVAGCLVVGTAFGAGVAPDYYNMLNGNGVASNGIYDYWDQIYTGSGCVTCDNASLTGGKGDLTDGIIATDNWLVTEVPAGNGPYVGWRNPVDPTITFHWNTAVTISSVTFYVDDSGGAGGVSPPESVIVDGNSFTVVDPAGFAPFAFTVSGFSFTGNDLAVTLNRSNEWVFLSEVEFNAAAAVPEPETYALMLAGLGLLGFVARHRKQQTA